MNHSALPYWLSLLVVIGAAYFGWKWWQVDQFQRNQSAGGIQYTGPPLEGFELSERSGKRFRSKDLQGKVWVVNLFFSTCPGTCKKLSGNIKMLHEREDLQDVTWVSITVDPGTDTQQVLQEYADRFGADPERWLFCRGDFKYIQRIGQEILSLPVLWRDHNDYGVVIDKRGRARGSYDLNRTSNHAKLIKLIQECQAEESITIEPAVKKEEAPKSDAKRRSVSEHESKDLPVAKEGV